MRQHRIFVALFRLLLPVILLSSACTFKEPQAPVWSVNLNVPLISKTYTMEDLADETDFLEVDNNAIIFTFDQEIDPFEVGNELMLSGATAGLTVSIPHPSPQNSQHSKSDSLLMPPEIIASQAIIKSGGITVTADNGTDYTLTASVTIPALLASGQAYIVTMQIPGNSIISNHFNLANLEFNPGSRYVAYTSVLRVDQVGTSGGDVDFTVVVDDMLFSYLSGTLDPVTIDVPDSEAELDIPDEYSNFVLGSAEVDLTVKSNFDLPRMVVNLNAIGRGLKDDPLGSVTMPINGILTDTSPGDGRFEETLHVSGLEQIINAIPEKIEFGGTVEIGDGSTVTLSDTSTIRATAKFTSPMTLALPADTTEMDTQALDIGDETKDIIAENLEQIELKATVENHLPFGVSVLFYFSDDSLTLYQNPMLRIGPLTIAPGQINGGIVINPVTSTPEISLSQEDLEVFQESEIYQGMRLIFPGTGGIMVTARPDDYITIIAHLESRVRVDFDDNDS